MTAERGSQERIETPAAVSYFTREQIEAVPADDLAGVLRVLPGFLVLFGDPVSGYPIVSSRGFFGGGEAEYVQLLIDGVPAADVESGLADWRRVRASEIERIEALRGPGSSLYGDTAMAGVVQVFTRRPDRSAARAALSAGSFRSLAVDGSFHRTFQRVRLGGSGWVSRTDGFRDHAEARQGAMRLAVQRATPSTVIALDVSGEKRRRQEPGPLSLAELTADRRSSNAIYQLDHDDNDKVDLAARFEWRAKGFVAAARAVAGAREGERIRTILFAPEFGDRAFRSISTRLVGGTFDLEKRFTFWNRENEWRAGVDVSRERLATDYHDVTSVGDPGALLSEASGFRQRLAVFASYGWHATSRLRLYTGVRSDRIRDSFDVDGGESQHDALSPRVGASVILGPQGRAQTALFVQLSRAFKAPTLDQLFDPRPYPDFSGGSFFISNPDLLPQRAVNFEAGVSSASPGAVAWELVAYRMNVEDEIDFNARTFTYDNIGRSRHVGIEASARLKDGGTISPSVTYSWTAVDALEGPSQGLQLKNIPRHLLRPGIGARLPVGLRADLRYTLSSGAYVDDENLHPLNGASVFDLRIARSFRRFVLHADVLNLGNDRYEEMGFTLAGRGGTIPFYYPGSGAFARFGISAEF